MPQLMRRLLAGTAFLAVCLSALMAVPPRAYADEAARDAFGPPGEQGAFDFEGYVLRAGAPYGRVRLSARATEHGTWAVRDAIQPVAAGADRVLATADLDRRLRTITGTYIRRGAKGFLRAAVTASEGAGYRIEHRTQDYENRLDVAGSDALSTLSAAILFLRLVPEEAAVYELPDLDPNPAPGDPYVVRARLEVHRKAPWRVGAVTREAWIVSYTRGTQTLRLALAVGDRALLGVDFVGLPFQFVPRGSGPVGLLEGVAADLMTPIEKAVARTRALRAALPAPGKGFDVRAAVRLGEARVGTVRLRAEPASLGGRPVWSVLESQVLRTGTSTVELETSGLLAPDLTVLRGEQLDKRPSGVWQVSYQRVAGGMRTVARGEGGGVALLDAAGDASTGLVPVLLLLRHVPANPTHYVLSGWDPRSPKTPKAGSGSFAFHAADVHIEVLGVAPFMLDGLTRRTLQARCTLRSGRRYDVHLEPATRAFVAVVGHMPKTCLVVGGATGKPVDWYDAVEGSPKTARQAFVKFGRGYHRPREDLLKAAFHWPSMVKQALALGRYEAGTSPARIQRDWVAVFVGMSKHRTQGDCDDLLFQILMTSREVTHADGSVTLHTLPVYGGHAYRMAEVDGRWWVVGID